MPTPFSDVYEKFSVIFQDKVLAGLTQTTLEEIFELYLSSSKSIYFKESRVDLTNVDTVLKQFNVELDSEEQWILAYGMRAVWVDYQVAHEDKLKNQLSDRDYQTYSPANLLDKLNDVKTNALNELSNMRVRYDYDVYGFE